MDLLVLGAVVLLAEKGQGPHGTGWNQPAPGTKVCTYCQPLGFAGLGHIETECRKKMAAQTMCTRCNEYGHAPSQCQFRKHVCEVCGMTGHSGVACFSLWHNGASNAPAAPAGNAAQADSSPTPPAVLTASGWRCKSPTCEEFNLDEKGKACTKCKKPRDKDDILKAADAIPLCKQKGTEAVERLLTTTDATTSYPMPKEEIEVLELRESLKRCIG